MWQAITYYATLLIEAVLGVFGIRVYEEPRYDVVERIGDRIEVRRYGPRLAAEVSVATTGDAGRSEAFGLLFNYIAGANTANGVSAPIATTTPVQLRSQRVAMTTPVRAVESAAAVQMQFFLPAKYTLENAPAPADPRVRMATVPAETVATIRFSGAGRDNAQRQSELQAALKASNWRPDGEAYVLTYDAPFTIPFVRRNEVAVAVLPSR